MEQILELGFPYCTKIVVSVINNGFFTDFFKIERLCSQRDPLSPYLFILVVEPMAADGGLKLINIVDFNSSLKLLWLKRLMSTYGSWQNIFEMSLGIPKILTFELDQQSLTEMIEKYLNPFQKDVLKSWSF